MNSEKTMVGLKIAASLAVLLFSNQLFASSRLDERLTALVNSPSQNDSVVRVLIFIEDQDLQDNVSRVVSVPDLDRNSRHKMVVNKLKSFRSTTTDQVESFLHIHSKNNIEKHWIIPAYTVEIPVSQIKTLSEIEGVDQIIIDQPIEVESPVSVSQAPSLASSAVSNELGMINVPQLWSLGLTGKGRLVCNFDTGVEGVHPALAPKWRGQHTSLHSAWFSVSAPDSIPFDKAGHGTHTMGTMVGSTATDSFGVAPGAEWIAAGVIDQGYDLTTTFSHILNAFEWAMNPDGDITTTDDVPDVILNSWGISTVGNTALAPCSTLFWKAIDNVEAAGIVTIFSAGNEGKLGSKTIRNPANRASTPYNAFSVGAVDGLRVIADFSSRGPSSCDTTQIKPEIVAPGVSIRSSTKGGGYAYMSGTSMAAPYIAGLVALCRQYNPDATPEQIKYAMIRSATDLGPAGEDNAYGWGLVDAVKMISFLPEPKNYEFSIVRQTIQNDGVALAGDSERLEIILSNPFGSIKQVTGELVVPNSNVIKVTSSTSLFDFGVGGTIAVSSQPFGLQIDPSVSSGTKQTLWLRLYDQNSSLLDSLTLSITVGYPASGTIGDINTGKLLFTVSDFGQFGLTEGSIYNSGGKGLSVNGGNNVLYEAGVVIAKSQSQISSGIRDSLGSYKPSGFRPVQSLSDQWTSANGAKHRNAIFDDGNAAFPISLTVEQDIISRTESDSNEYFIMSYKLINHSLEPQNGIRFGFLADFDISSGNDQIGFDEMSGVVYQYGETGALIGLVALSENVYFNSLDNGSQKRGISKSELYTSLSGKTSLDTSTQSDWMILVCANPSYLAVGDTSDVIFAFVSGGNKTELIHNANKIRAKFNLPTSTDDDNPTVPQAFSVAQNYPNPFNPNTLIAFVLPQSSDVSVEVYNSLGQHVKTLFQGKLGSGEHKVTWDGTDNSNSRTGSGVYFYRITALGYSETRKMVLLK